MTLIDQEIRHFTRAYTHVLTSAWSEDRYSDLLDSDPLEALAEAGLRVPAGSRVRVERAPHDPSGVMADREGLDAQVDLWFTGRVSGIYTLYVPQMPELDTAALEPDELAAIGGGTACCCCGPCSCCT